MRAYFKNAPELSLSKVSLEGAATEADALALVEKMYQELKAKGVDKQKLDYKIEQRGPEEVATMTGQTADGRIETVRIVPEGSPVANYAFDVTPARLVTGLITERGVLRADRAAIAAAFPERIAAAAE